MFSELPTNLDFPAEEKRILAFWEMHRIYEKSLEIRRRENEARCARGEPEKHFVFYEGPPTANGLPHPGHCLTRAIKDLFPRYKTMTGHYCLRKGGWDTHGLPVEVEVCKELGIHTKEEIEAYGVERFNRKCLESVFRYTTEWEEMTRRLGFWINLDEAYVTYHKSYVESVWWSLKQLFDAGLLHQGYKIVWWWAQGGTALSAGEVGQGYREVDDPSVYVRFPLVMDGRAEKFIADCGLRIADLRSELTDLKSEIPDSNSARISFLVWTTTPWTLPSNMFAAVHKDFDYALVLDEEDGERLIMAQALVEPIAKKLKAQKRWRIERTFKGNELVGLRYEPPFECYSRRPADAFVQGSGNTTLFEYAPALANGRPQAALWRVLAGDFVTLDAGTGLVHEAPAFGEVDFDLLQQYRKEFENPDTVPFLCAVAPNGTFTDEAPEFCRGRWVKDCDKDIIADMKRRGVLVYQEQYRHDYPFCWRAEEDPLIQYPRRSWFIRTTQFKQDMLDNNERINWLPDHIKHGRFGKFLESNVDWSLSRERYWGTPLPIWVCDNASCGHSEAIDSYDALVGKPGVAGLEVWENAKVKEPGLSDHLKVHKPYIDAVSYACPKCGTKQSRDREGLAGAPGQSRMRRVPEVIDCWYDSGAMPFAQWGFPHTGREMFAEQLPADFISEALDQTRGWFYSLVAISTLLFGEKGVARNNPQSAIRNPNYPLPFRTCIVLGLLMGEDGLKMSKQKKNYKDPGYIFEHEGADAMRWLFFSGQTPWTSIRFQETAIAEGQREFLIRLYNCYSFFIIYANIDKWTPDGTGVGWQPTAGASGDVALNDLDRWVFSTLAQCCVTIYDRMEAYDNFNAARALSGFVDALSNWYVRRSRDRFWKSGMDADKRAAYATLYHCLVTLTKLIAPFTPFLAESMYQNLVVEGTKRRSHEATKPQSYEATKPQSDEATKPRCDEATKRGSANGVPESVHLCDYPITAENRAEIEQSIDTRLNEEIELVRRVVSCGRAARNAAKLRIRQPISTIELYHRQASVIRRHEETIRDELNVKRIEHVAPTDIDRYVHYEVKPDFKKIGPKYGPLAPKIKQALAAHPNPDEIVKQLESEGVYHMSVDGQDVELTGEELLVELHAREGYAAERIPGQGILVLDTHITPELRDEGWARDLVNQIQQVRKQLNLRYEQRIDLAIVGSEDITRVVNAHAEYIRGETLAQTLLNQELPGVQPVKVDIEGHTAEIYVKPL